MAQVELFLDFDVAVGTIEAGSEREILRSKSLLHNTDYLVGHLEQLRGWNVAEGILLCRCLSMLTIFLVITLNIDFNVLGG